MKQELYIDGNAVDLNENTQITIELRTNLFQDISKIAANRTYTIKLPKTVHNCRILGNADNTHVDSPFPYEKHTADYFRNGVQLIENGTLYLLSSTDTFEVSIVWGVNAALQSVFNDGLMLNEMPEGTDVLNYSRYNMMKLWSGRNENYGYFVCNYLDYPDKLKDRNWMEPYLSSHAFADFPDMGYLLPCARMRWVLNKIETLYGITFQMSEEAGQLVDDMLIPLTGQKGSDLSLNNTMFAAINADSEMINSNRGVELTPTGTSVLLEDSNTNKTRYKVVQDCKANASINLTAKVRTNAYMRLATVMAAYHNDAIYNRLIVYHTSSYAYERDVYVARGPIVIKDEDGFVVDPFNYTDTNCDDYTINILADLNDLELKQGDYVGGITMMIGDYYAGDTMTGVNQFIIYDLTFVLNFVEIEKVVYGMKYPIVINLPEIKILDLLKYVAFMTGTYPQMVKGDSVTFIPIETVWNNKTNSVDWSHKLIHHDKHRKPAEVQYRLDGWAKRNIYKYKDNDEVKKGVSDGVIEIADDTLDTERNAYEFPFYASRYNNIPVYGLDDEITEQEADNLLFPSSPQTDDPLTGNAATPRIMYRGFFNIINPQDETQSIDLCMAVFSQKLYAQTSLDAYYKQYIESLKHIHIIIEQVRLTDVELTQFDERKPIYLAQYGRYYAVLKIESNKANIAKVTMFELNI